MDLYLTFSYWIFQPYVWIIFGLTILIVDIFLGFILLPFSISALIIGGVIYSDQNLVFGDFIVFETWRQIILSYAVLSLVSVGLLRFFLHSRKRDKFDINKY